MALLTPALGAVITAGFVPPLPKGEYRDQFASVTLAMTAPATGSPVALSGASATGTTTLVPLQFVADKDITVDEIAYRAEVLSSAGTATVQLAFVLDGNVLATVQTAVTAAGGLDAELAGGNTAATVAFPVHSPLNVSTTNPVMTAAQQLRVMPDDVKDVGTSAVAPFKKYRNVIPRGAKLCLYSNTAATSMTGLVITMRYRERKA